MSEPSATPTPRRDWRTTLLVVAAVALALVVVQALGWRLDPPRDLPNGIYPRDLWAEGAFKAHEARRWALFGVWSTNDVDNYRFWLVQSPAHVWPLALWLKTLGVTWSNLRLYSVLTYAAGWLLLLGAAVRLRRDDAAIAVTVGMLGDFYLRHAARSALIEVPLTSLSCAVFAVAVLALRNPRWVFALPVLSTLAILTKQSGAFLAVFSVIAALLVRHRHRHHPSVQQATRAWVGLGSVLALGFLAYALSDEYWRTIEWNANHMMGRDNDRASNLRLWYLDPLRIARRLLNHTRWRDAIWFYVPMTLPFALPFAGWVGVRTFLSSRLWPWVAERIGWDPTRRRPVDDDDLLVALLLALTVGMLFFTHQTRLRFALTMFPWMWWSTGRAIGLLMAHRRSWGLAGAGFAVAGFVATHGVWHAEHAGDPSTDLYDGNTKLAQLLDEDDVLVGKTAPWMAFESRAEHYVLRFPFNCSAESVRALAPTHLLRVSVKEYTRVCLRKLRPDWLRGAETLVVVPYKSRNIYLHTWPAEMPGDTPVGETAETGEAAASGEDTKDTADGA